MGLVKNLSEISKSQDTLNKFNHKLHYYLTDVKLLKNGLVAYSIKSKTNVLPFNEFLTSKKSQLAKNCKYKLLSSNNLFSVAYFGPYDEESGVKILDINNNSIVENDASVVLSFGETSRRYLIYYKNGTYYSLYGHNQPLKYEFPNLNLKTSDMPQFQNYAFDFTRSYFSKSANDLQTFKELLKFLTILMQEDVDNYQEDAPKFIVSTDSDDLMPNAGPFELPTPEVTLTNTTFNTKKDAINNAKDIMTLILNNYIQENSNAISSDFHEFKDIKFFDAKRVEASLKETENATI